MEKLRIITRNIHLSPKLGKQNIQEEVDASLSDIR